MENITTKSSSVEVIYVRHLHNDYRRPLGVRGVYSSSNISDICAAQMPSLRCSDCDHLGKIVSTLRYLYGAHTLTDSDLMCISPSTAHMEELAVSIHSDI